MTDHNSWTEYSEQVTPEIQRINWQRLWLRVIGVYVLFTILSHIFVPVNAPPSSWPTVQIIYYILTYFFYFTVVFVFIGIIFLVSKLFARFRTVPITNLLNNSLITSFIISMFLLYGNWYAIKNIEKNQMKQSTSYNINPKSEPVPVIGIRTIQDSEDKKKEISDQKTLKNNETVNSVSQVQGNSFVKLDFGGEISIEIPRNWSYLDDNLKKHLNTAVEAATRLAKITPNPGENVILVAGNAYTSFRTASATLRLSVRQGDAPTQADVREINSISQTKLSQVVAPAVEETRRVMIGVDGVQDVKLLGVSVVSNNSLNCIFLEFENKTIDGPRAVQTYICPMSSRAVKLTTSYRKSEAALFRPVTQYVWQSLSASSAAEAGWRQYPIAESGFTVAFPLQPQSRSLPQSSGDGSHRVYQAVEGKSQPSIFSVFVDQPRDQGIFEPASMDAYLSGSIKSLVGKAEEGKLQYSGRVTFRSCPGLEYKFSQTIKERPYIARGVIFMIDGGHMRISMLHPSSDPEADKSFKRYLESFQLTPIAYRPSATRFSDKRGVSFSPPQGWVQKPTQNAVQVARFTHLTRSILLLVAGNSAYRCNNFQRELQASGRLKKSSAVRLGDQQFIKLTSFEDVPKYKVRLTNVQYCMNSRLGAVVLAGSEEESMFFRWAQVFEGAAASIRVR